MSSLLWYWLFSPRYGLVNKILHGPIEQLKAAQAAPGGVRLGALVRQLFGLGREDPDPDEPGETEGES